MGYLCNGQTQLWACHIKYYRRVQQCVLKADRVLTVYGIFPEYYKRLAFQFEERVESIAGYNDNYVLQKTLKR